MQPTKSSTKRRSSSRWGKVKKSLNVAKRFSALGRTARSKSQNQNDRETGEVHRRVGASATETAMGRRSSSTASTRRGRSLSSVDSNSGDGSVRGDGGGYSGAGSSPQLLAIERVGEELMKRQAESLNVLTTANRDLMRYVCMTEFILYTMRSGSLICLPRLQRIVRG